MILFKYILKEFFKYAFLITILSITLFIIFDFLPRSTRYFSRYQATFPMIMRFYLYHSSEVLGQVLPVASLIASVVTMVIMNKSNEITAMRAVGWGPVKLIRPMLCGGLILTILAAINGEYITPICMKKLHYLKDIVIEKEQPRTVYRANQWFNNDSRVFYNFEEYNTTLDQMEIIKIIELDERFNLVHILEAGSASYDTTKDSWILQNVLDIKFKDNLIEKNAYETREVKIPTDPTGLKKNVTSISEFSASELDKLIKQRKKYGMNILEYSMEYHSKVAFYFASFLISIIGLFFAFRSERSTGLASGIMFAILLGMSYWFSLTFSSMLGNQHILPVMLAAWLPNLMIVVVVCCLLKTIKNV